MRAQQLEQPFLQEEAGQKGREQRRSGGGGEYGAIGKLVVDGKAVPSARHQPWAGRLGLCAQDFSGAGPRSVSQRPPADERSPAGGESRHRSPTQAEWEWEGERGKHAPR